MDPSVVLASLISGMLGAMGFGGGSVLIIYLTALAGIQQKEAQGINLIFFVAISLFANIFNLKNQLIDKRESLHILPLSVIGLMTGYVLLPMIPSDLLKKIFGGALIILGLKELFSKENKKLHRRQG